MNYADGQAVRVGDRVILGAEHPGVVVCVIDDSRYSDRAPEADWSYLGRGAVVEFATIGLVHYETVEADLILAARAER